MNETKKLFNGYGDEIGRIKIAALSPDKDGRELGNAFVTDDAREWHQDMIDGAGNRFVMVWRFSEREAALPTEGMPWKNSRINRVVLQRA